jgi:hypothetical protein
LQRLRFRDFPPSHTCGCAVLFPENELAVEAKSFSERLAEYPPFIVRRRRIRIVFRFRLPPVSDELYEGVDEGVYEDVDEGVYEDVDEGVYEDVDEGVYEDVDEGAVVAAGFLLNNPVKLFQKPPFIVLFFLCRIYIII